MRTYIIYLNSNLFPYKQFRPIEVQACSLTEAAEIAQRLKPNTIISMGWPK